MDLSIVIAHRGDALGLWATVQSVQEQLLHDKFSYNFFIAANGSPKVDEDLKRVIQFIKRSGHLGNFEHYVESLAPPIARQRASNQADGRILFFFDNHCLVARDFFRRSMLDFDHFGMDMLHSTTKFYEGEEIHYHYSLRLAFNFWATSCLLPMHPLKPYRTAAAGHGGFAVRRDVWHEVGGYGPEDLFAGYGGEEIYFDLKMALLDKTNWLDPRVIHYHYAGKRGYPRHYTDAYYLNLLTCARVIGGVSWLEKVYESMLFQPKLASDRTMFDLMVEAEERSRDHAREIADKRYRTLNEQLEKFTREQIAH